MKTAKILLLALCSLIVLSCGNDKTYSYQEYGLNRPVKSIKVTTYEAESKFGEVVKGDLKWNGHYLAEFNSVGNIISLTEYDDDGDLNGVTKYKYNNDDNVIDASEYDEDGKLHYNQSLEYNGSLLSKVTSTLKYSKEENVYVYEITREGETITSETTHHNGELISVVKYSKYDKTGVEWVRYDGDGKETAKGSSLLNKDGKVTKYNLSETEYYEVTWNEKGLPVYLKNAELHNNSYVTYNFHGESVFYIEYEYDNKGNWIKQTVFEGEMKKPVTISERVIVY